MNTSQWVRGLLVWTALSLGGVGAEVTVSAEALAKAEEIVGGQCFVCHGLQGESSSPIYPRLAGQHAEYIAKQLAAFKLGSRASETMQPIVKPLTQEDMKAIGVYYQKQESVPTDPTDKDLVGMGRYLFQKGNVFSAVPACASCHGVTGLGTPQLPRLAGQRANYTETQLKSFHDGSRKDPNGVMSSVAKQLTALEMHALAEYISALRSP